MTKLFILDSASEAYGVPKEIFQKAIDQRTIKTLNWGNGLTRLTEATIDEWLLTEERVR